MEATRPDFKKMQIPRPVEPLVTQKSARRLLRNLKKDSTPALSRAKREVAYLTIKKLLWERMCNSQIKPSDVMGTEKYIFSHLQVSTSQEVQRITVRQNEEQVEVVVPQKMALSTRQLARGSAAGIVGGTFGGAVGIVSSVVFFLSNPNDYAVSLAEFVSKITTLPTSMETTILATIGVAATVCCTVGWAIGKLLARAWNAAKNSRKTWADAPAFMQAVDEAIKKILWPEPKEA